MNREARRREWMTKIRKELTRNPEAKLKVPADLFEPEEVEALLLDMGFKRMS